LPERKQFGVSVERFVVNTDDNNVPRGPRPSQHKMSILRFEIHQMEELDLLHLQGCGYTASYYPSADKDALPDPIH
jgi:hypothetical protein